MASYTIEFKQSAERDVRRIPPASVGNMLAKIEALAENPFPRGSVKLSGAEATYRLRVGPYRVVYEIHSEARAVVIQHVRHRREAYRRP